jgi:hypothetical protein
MFRRRSSTASSLASSSGPGSPVPASDDPKAMIGEYKAKYLGSVSVEQAFPKDPEDPLLPDAIKRCLQQKLEPRKVFLRIKATEISVADRKSLEVIQNTPITEVSFSGVDPRNSKRFLFITQNRSSLKSCHIFDVKFDAVELPNAIGKAFELFAVEMKRLKSQAAGGGGNGAAAGEGGSIDSAITDLVRAAMEERKKSKSAAQIIGKVFDAFFLGTNCVDKKFGEDVVTSAWQLLKKEREVGKKGKDSKSAEDACSITITDETLTVFNRFTAETMFHEFIKTISFIFVVEHFANSEVVAYIAIDERLVRAYVSVCLCVSLRACVLSLRTHSTVSVAPLDPLPCRAVKTASSSRCRRATAP